MSQAQDRELTLRERALLQFHLAICRGCRAVNAQFRFLRRAVRSLYEVEIGSKTGADSKSRGVT